MLAIMEITIKARIASHRGIASFREYSTVCFAISVIVFLLSSSLHWWQSLQGEW